MTVLALVLASAVVPTVHAISASYIALLNIEVQGAHLRTATLYTTDTY
jgi:hypothetical protein